MMKVSDDRSSEETDTTYHKFLLCINCCYFLVASCGVVEKVDFIERMFDRSCIRLWFWSWSSNKPRSASTLHHHMYYIIWKYIRSSKCNNATTAAGCLFDLVKRLGIKLYPEINKKSLQYFCLLYFLSSLMNKNWKES